MLIHVRLDASAHTYTHTHTHTIGILCTNDQLVAEAATYTTQHTKQTQQKNIRAHSGIPNCDLYNRETAENLSCGLVNMGKMLP